MRSHVPPQKLRLRAMVVVLATTIALSTTAVVDAQSDNDATYQTRNGARTYAQLQSELTAAGYGGPWDAPAMLSAYDRAGLPTIDPYANDSTWSCMPANASCGRDPWWAEWNELQDPAHVTYAAIGTRFVTERRYAEAIDLLWQWPEGKTLLNTADASGVLVMTLDYDYQTAFATYSPQRKLIAFNSRFTTTPTWMIADVLAHELSHAADDAHGVNASGTSTACFNGETAATQTQQRFLVWLTRVLQPAGLPNVAAVTASLSKEHAELATSLYEIGFSTNVRHLVDEAYDGTC